MRTRVREFRGAAHTDHEDRLVAEEPLEIRLGWPRRPARRLHVTMRTPGHDFELVAGFLTHEGIAAPGSLRRVAYCTDVELSPDERFNVVTAELDAEPGRIPGERYDGPSATSAACGVCGKQSIDDVLAPGACAHGSPGEAWPDLVLDVDVVRSLPGALREAQRVFDRTGGLHAAGLFTADGAVLGVREDVGRHNAVDKVLGARVLAGEPTAVPVMALSGRIGFELVQKAVVSGVGALVAVGAPSSLAVDLAREAGLVMVGFTRGERCVVYAGADKVRHVA